MTALAKKPRGLCQICGTRIDPVAGEVHPLCEPETAALIRSQDRARRAGLKLGESGRAQALKSDPVARSWALNQIRALATREEFVSADDLRDEFDAYGVPQNMRGGLWTRAKAEGWVTDAGDMPSGGRSAHGKKIARYRSLIYQARRTA